MNDNLQMSAGKPLERGEFEVGVLGSARLTENDNWWTQAHKLGMLLAAEGFVVVTGGYGGLMAAVSHGAHEKGGRVIGLPMQHWAGIKPNQWNIDLRWSGNYGTRMNHILHCDAVIALPGGVGTLSEMAVVWAASQTEGSTLPLVLLGDCWPPVIKSIREHLVGLTRCLVRTGQKKGLEALSTDIRVDSAARLLNGNRDAVQNSIA